MIDLDRFHSINELHGRDHGDQIIIRLATRLQNHFVKENTVFRDSSDTFAIYIEDVDYDELSKIGQELLDLISAPFEIDKRIFYLTASIGISHYPSLGRDIRTLLHQAEMPMFKVKDEGKNNYLIYELEDAARLYVTTEREEIEDKWGTTTEGEVTTNTLTVNVKEDLYDKGFLEERSGESPLTGTVIVTRTPLNDDEGFTYEYDASSVSTTNQQ